MRDAAIFGLLLLVVFFGVGEWRGWYVGVPGSTPVLVYKKDHRAETTVRTVIRDDMPIEVSGRVRRGTVTLEITYERPASIQSGRASLPERTVFEQTYRTGQTIAFDQVLDEGGGVYRVVLTYADATGVFRVRLPRSSEL